MNKIVMVTNFSGNVGKTTITKNLLGPNLFDVKLFAVEDINAGHNQGEAVQLSADETRKILESVIEASFEQDVIVDIGASNVSNFFTHLKTFDDFQSFVTAVIIPTEPSEKVQVDTVSTMKYLLNDLAFPPEKLKVIINKAPVRDTETRSLETFKTVYDCAFELGISIAGIIPENDTFQLAAQRKLTIPELAAQNPKDLLSSIKAAGGDAKEASKLVLAITSAKKLQLRLSDIFQKLDLDNL